MLADLERLIALQVLESDRAAVARIVADIPAQQADLDARAAAARATADEVRARHAALTAAKRDAEKDMAAAESRLAKFRDQQQNVKTNKEYQAMIHEIDTAKADVDKWSEQVLIKMDEVDAAAAELKTAETALKAAEAEIATARKALDQAREQAERQMADLDTRRASVAATIEDARGLQIFEGLVKNRKTAALSQAIDGLCIECRVRLRPQVFAEVRRNDAIRQCDNCQRILYYIAPPPAAAPAEPATT